MGIVTMSDFWADKRVLITGGAGYLAYSVLALLKDRAASIVRLDRPGADFFPMVGKTPVKNVEADIRDSNVWKMWMPEVDVVFHFAAQTSAVKADADPDADWAINVAPVLSLIDACRPIPSSPIVLLAGTATECGLTESLPVDETISDHPITAYDRHKLLAEKALEQADQEGVLRAITLRLANLYGPGPRSSNADRGILNLMVRRALSGEPVTVYGTGEYMRDYLFVEDAARAFLAAAENVGQTHGNYFLLGTGRGHSVLNAFELVASRVSIHRDQPVPVELIDPPSPLPLIETRNFVADSSLLATKTGWRAVVDLKSGIDRTIEFYERDE